MLLYESLCDELLCQSNLSFASSTCRMQNVSSFPLLVEEEDTVAPIHRSYSLLHPPYSLLLNVKGR